MKRSNTGSFLPTEAGNDLTNGKPGSYNSFKQSVVKGFMLSILMIAILLVMQSCNKDNDESAGDKEIKQLKTSVAPFVIKSAGVAAGYNQDVTGYRTQMGYHYLNVNLLDNKFEINKPELLIYAPYGSDSMKLVAVEYATPIEDLNNPPAKPEGFTGTADVWEINTEFKLWTLHVWVGLDNPHGL